MVKATEPSDEELEAAAFDYDLEALKMLTRTKKLISSQLAILEKASKKAALSGNQIEIMDKLNGMLKKTVSEERLWEKQNPPSNMNNEQLFNKLKMILNKMGYDVIPRNDNEKSTDNAKAQQE